MVLEGQIPANAVEKEGAKIMAANSAIGKLGYRLDLTIPIVRHETEIARRAAAN
jgi:hypothetical protein